MSIICPYIYINNIMYIYIYTYIYIYINLLIFFYLCVNHRYTYVAKYIYNIFNIPITANLYDTLKTINVYKRDMSHFLVVAFPLYFSVVVFPLYLGVSPSVSEWLASL